MHDSSLPATFGELLGLVSPEQVRFPMGTVDNGPPQNLQGSSVPYDDGLRSGLVSPEQVRFLMGAVVGGPPQNLQGSSASFNRYQTIKMQVKGGLFLKSCFLLWVVFLAGLPVVGASAASAPGSSTSGMPSTLQIFSYMGISATVIAMMIAFTACCRKCYHHRRERGHGVRGALDVLLRPFQERRGGMYMSVDSLEMGEEMVNGLVVDSRV